jgi:hypothetical protein
MNFIEINLKCRHGHDERYGSRPPSMLVQIDLPVSCFSTDLFPSSLPFLSISPTSSFQCLSQFSILDSVLPWRESASMCLGMNRAIDNNECLHLCVSGLERKIQYALGHSMHSMYLGNQTCMSGLNVMSLAEFYSLDARRLFCVKTGHLPRCIGGVTTTGDRIVMMYGDEGQKIRKIGKRVKSRQCETIWSPNDTRVLRVCLYRWIV